MAEKTHDALARLLSEAGVEVLFGVTGDANLMLVAAFARAGGATASRRQRGRHPRSARRGAARTSP